MSVLENVTVGALLRQPDLAAAREEAERCLGLVGLADQRAAFARELSTGQRKRLEMARAMATRPRLLLLDEVTGGVDQRSIPGLVALIGRLRDEGVTLVVIEHNMRVIMAVADRIVALHLGRKIADGSAGRRRAGPGADRGLSGSGLHRLIAPGSSGKSGTCARRPGAAAGGVLP